MLLKGNDMTAALQNILADCTAEMNDIQIKINALSPLDKTKKYLTNYALVKACGTLEFVYRSIVVDYFSGINNTQIHTYLDKQVLQGSMSATYNNMCGLLNKFDDSWKTNFKNAVNAHVDSQRLISSLDSLVTNRHSFAHGRMPTATFQDIYNYYNDGVTVLGIFDSVVI